MLIGWLLAWGGLFWCLSAILLPGWIRQARWDLLPPDDIVDADVHVVVPARDEAMNIGPAASALAAIRGEQVSFVVVDDGSTDGTARVAAECLAGEDRGAVLSAGARPPGWSGKAWACRQGVEARPDADWYLFVDADVCVHPRLLGALLRRAGEQVDLVSAFGRWILPSVGVAWLMPALGWLIRGAVVPRRVESGQQAFANGQVMLVRGAAYRRVGGHEAVQDEVLDDVGLAAALQRAESRCAIVWMPDAFSVRAYDTLGGLVRGYQKNVHAGLGRRRWLGLLVASQVLWAYLGPLAALLIGLGMGDLWLGLAGLLGLAVMIGLRLVLDRMERRTGWLAPLQPLAGLGIAWIFVSSALLRRSSWKGRAFVDGKAAHEKPPLQ